MSHTALKFYALSVAYKAKCNEVDELDVDHLLTEATQLLEETHPIFRGISNFATQYLRVHRDPDAVTALGDELAAQVESWAITTPPDLNRKDIHG